MRESYAILDDLMRLRMGLWQKCRNTGLDAPGRVAVRAPPQKPEPDRHNQP
jgi:hypothetical protein